MIKSNRSHLSVMAKMAFIALILFYTVPAQGAATTIDQKLQYVVNFIVNSVGAAPSRILNVPSSNDVFLSGFPAGTNYKNQSQQLYDPVYTTYELHNECYLQNNVLYAIKALKPYTTQGTSFDGTTTYIKGSTTSNSLQTFYDKYFPATDPTTGGAITEGSLNYCTVGVYQPLMGAVPIGKYYATTTSGSVINQQNPLSQTYLLRTGYNATPFTVQSLANADGPKDLMKFGCLLELIRYNHGDSTALTRAEGYFQTVVAGDAVWDGTPFASNFEGFHIPNDNTNFETRDLEYFLICEQAFEDAGDKTFVQKTDGSIAIGTAARNILWTTCWDNPTLTNPITGRLGTGGI